MIKVYINNEWIMTFENQIELDNWLQKCDADYLNSIDIKIYYSEGDI